MSKLYDRLAVQATAKWRAQKRLPFFDTTASPGYVNYIMYDTIIYHNYHLNSGHNFMYYDDSGFAAYGPIIPRVEVYKSLWDELDEATRTILMSEVLGRHE